MTVQIHFGVTIVRVCVPTCTCIGLWVWGIFIYSPSHLTRCCTFVGTMSWCRDGENGALQKLWLIVRGSGRTGYWGQLSDSLTVVRVPGPGLQSWHTHWLCCVLLQSVAVITVNVENQAGESWVTARFQEEW